MKSVFNTASLVLVLITCFSCSSKEEIRNSLPGSYAREFDNEYDNFKDTIIIKANDQSGFDITDITWSSAKKDDPDRPVNKVAGQWGTKGPQTVTGIFQQSDTTIRIEEQFTGRLRILSFNLQQGILNETTFSGHKFTYKKVK